MSPQRPENHPKNVSEDDTKEPALKHQELKRNIQKLVGISHAQ